jgi:hypothetical protein
VLIEAVRNVELHQVATGMGKARGVKKKVPQAA